MSKTKAPKKTAKKKAASKNGTPKSQLAPGQKPRRMAEKDRDLQQVRNVDLPEVDPLTSNPDGKKPTYKPRNVKKDDALKLLRFTQLTRKWIEFVIFGPMLLTNKVMATTLAFMEWQQRNPKLAKAMKDKKIRLPRNPEQEFLEHCHLCTGSYNLEDGPENNLCGFKAVGIKKSFATAAYHLSVSVDMISIMRFTSLHGPYEGLIPLLHRDGTPVIPEMRTDPTYVGSGKEKDLMPAYRPVFYDWSMRIQLRYFEHIHTPEEILDGFQKTGEFIGTAAWTNERGGDFGSFDIDRDSIRLLSDDFTPEQYRCNVMPPPPFVPPKIT
jgi:hypothetical protein